MRLVYLGTPEAAVAPLRALVEAGHDIATVVSQPDRKRGRGGALMASPVKQAAVELGLPVTDQVDEALALHRDTPVDLGVVVAFGQLIKAHVLAELDFVNIHFSLLPRWRGAAPVERAILAGDRETGCCLMALEVGLDTGPVYRRVVTPIDERESADELRSRLVSIGTTMLVSALDEGLGEAEVQTGEVTHAAKLVPAEFVLDFTETADQVLRRIRVGGAHTTFRGKRLKVLQAIPLSAQDLAAQFDTSRLPPGRVHDDLVGTGTVPVKLLIVQPEGKQPMTAIDWARGARLAVDEHLGVN